MKEVTELAVHAPTVLPGHTLSVVCCPLGLEGVRVGSETSQRQQDPEGSQCLLLLLSSRGGFAGLHASGGNVWW